MKTFDHLVSMCSIEEIPEELQRCGERGYEFVNLVVIQKQSLATRVIGGQLPQITTEFMLIFKKETDKINDNKKSN